MNFYKTTAAFGATACLLMASTAFGAATSLPASDTFESNAGNWVGDVTRETGAVTVPQPAGWPISATNAVNSYVLSVSGSATNEFTGANANPFVDMMVKVSKPDDGLNGLDADGAKFAIAVDTDGKFKRYTGSAWVALSETAYVDDMWVRVTMKFDYTAKKCIVALNGDTCPSGPFDLLDNTATELASIEIKGSTAIDEVLVAQNATPAFADDTAVVADGATATKKWLTENDVVWPENPTLEQVEKLDTQYKLGLDPTTDNVALPLSFEQDGSSSIATLSFPGFGAYGGTGTYVLKSSTDKTTWNGTTVVTPSGTGVNTVQVDLTGENGLTAGVAKYYRIEATAPVTP